MHSVELIALNLFKRGLSLIEICEIYNCEHAECVNMLTDKIFLTKDNKLIRRYKNERNQFVLEDFKCLKSVRRVAKKYHYTTKSVQEFLGLEDISINGMLNYHKKDIAANFRKGKSAEELTSIYDIDLDTILKHIRLSGFNYIKLYKGKCYHLSTVGKVLRYFEEDKNRSTKSIAELSGLDVKETEKIILCLNYCSKQEIENIRAYASSVSEKGYYKGTSMYPEDV